MRTIKLTHAQFRTWRLNAPLDAENPLSGRDLLKKELLETNEGMTFRLTSPLGRFLGTVRGENSTVGSAPMGMQNGAPHPDSCVCKAYAGTKPGEHHAVCQFRQAWENGKGLALNNAPPPVNQPTNLNPAMNVTSQKVAPPIDTTPRVQHMQVAKEASTAPLQMPTTQRAVAPRNPIDTVDGKPEPRAAAPFTQGSPAGLPSGVQVQVPAVVALIPPGQCDCRQFAKPSDADPKQHHFICQNYDKWKTAHPTVAAPLPGEEPTHPDTEKPPPADGDCEDLTEYVLADLDTQRVLRDATSEEVELARAEEEKSGSPIITLDEGVYAVVERPRPQQPLPGNTATP